MVGGHLFCVSAGAWGDCQRTTTAISLHEYCVPSAASGLKIGEHKCGKPSVYFCWW